MLPLALPLAFFSAYLIGSISSAIIVCRFMHLPDPRSQGSKNPGATNVLRIGGAPAALLTVSGDLLKGLLPVLLAKLSGFNSFAVSLIALAALLGHFYPIFFHFRGGKGVATFLGGMLALSWLFGLLLIATWLVIAIGSRYSSLAAIVTTLCAPLYAWYFFGLHHALVIGVMSILLLIRHHQNIRKLFTGTEARIGR